MGGEGAQVKPGPLQKGLESDLRVKGGVGKKKGAYFLGPEKGFGVCA